MPHLISHTEEVDLSTLGVTLGDTTKLVKSMNLLVLYKKMRFLFSDKLALLFYLNILSELIDF